LSLPHEEINVALQAQGANVTGSVSKRSDYLVAGANPGSKLANARGILAWLSSTRNSSPSC
jgi:DNA ligase (NAD+)